MFDSEKFIKEIRKRKVLYDINCIEYNDRAVKTQAWLDVGKAMIPDWDNMNDEERLNEEKNLRNKWRNIRDYFIKELKLQHIHGERKRTRYSYFNHLLFLVPFCKLYSKRGRNRLSTVRQTSTQPPITVTCKVEMSDGENDDPVVDYNNYDIPSTSDDSSNKHADLINQNYSRLDPLSGEITFDNDMPNIITPNDGHFDMSCDNDYDKMFLISLLPSIRQVPEHMKLQVRIQIQQILANALSAPK
ncbi:hypothetical protein HCN44_001191 [Aphidius gifuensis]|uniref:Transcription factor Adf-1 n=1 Tax=Aphidius gifuensis TaxID=684658 RepID=A0A834XJY9_APHGI|nr:uncharacterized protein LOC122856910 [Aphidius gifuensis]XP_044014741.1 uncharacterized protein LOC122856910 [Aphidius gifuensis]XP_044014742.1 uncharacterized protein LOC122856910 [Aphidius gifuensis]XP_044014743.1 uncharacterized protein LOC122856910 [Aphidius gifuensis]KAF7988618.1 hypothetical protein HCN44_001191 [Aphidius gifuensis]